MSIIKSNMTAPPPSSGGLSDIGEMNSLRFDGLSYLSRTFGTGSQNGWTLSLWAKFTKTVADYEGVILWNSYNGRENVMSVYNGVYQIYEYKSTDSPTNNYVAKINGDNVLLRDFSAWYHIVVKADIANSIINTYLNGTKSPDYTIHQATTNLSNNCTVNIGLGGGRSYSGYLANIHFIDGQALTPHYFGAEVSGIWVPKAFDGTSSDTDHDVSGASFTYGSNGFHLDFSLRGEHTIQTLGNAELKTSSSSGYIDDPVPPNLSPTNQALAFDGSGSLKIDPFVQLTSDFTAEGWVSRSASNWNTATNHYWFKWKGNSTSSKEFYFRGGHHNKLSFWDETYVVDFGAFDHTSSSWEHIAFVRENGVISCYLNGVKLGVTANTSDTFKAEEFELGSNFLGGMNHIRVSNVARYSGASISDWQNTTHSFTTDTNTLLLITDQNNIDSTTFVDQSGTGDVSIGYDSSGNNNHWQEN